METWTFPEECYILQDFRLLSRLDCYNNESEERCRNKRGIKVYIKHCALPHAEYLFGIEKMHKNQQHTYVLQIIAFRFKQYFCIVLYRSPLFPEALFRNTLLGALSKLQNEHEVELGKVIIIGDFNICRKTLIRSNIEDIMEENGFQSLLEKTLSTTKYGTQIDWAFSNVNLENSVVKIYKTIYSHHDALLLAMNAQ